MSVALTLAGEQVIKTTASYITSIKSVMGVADDTADAQNGKTKKEDKPADHKAAWAPLPGYQRFIKPPPGIQMEQRPYQITDELAMAKEGPKKPAATKLEEAAVIAPVQPGVAERIAAAAVTQDTALAIAAPAPTFDPYAAFLTPSALPFDVYSTTLALGNNYGFGEYYGMDSGSGTYSAAPDAPTTISVLALGTFINTRKRVF